MSLKTCHSVPILRSYLRYFIIPPKVTEVLGGFLKNSSKLKSHKTNFSFPVGPLLFIQQILFGYLYELGTMPHPGDQDT